MVTDINYLIRPRFGFFCQGVGPHSESAVRLINLLLTIAISSINSGIIHAFVTCTEFPIHNSERWGEGEQ